MNTVLSIIVPIYNIDEYIDTCLNSIIVKRNKSIEIILVDDGSTDKSGSICDYYASIDDRINVIHKENGGLVSARKRGIKSAKGDYITFVDGDDWIDIDWYINAIDTINNTKPDIMAFGCVIEYDTNHSKISLNSSPDGLYEGDSLNNLKECCIIKNSFFEWNILPHLWNKIIRKNLLSDVIENTDDCITFGEDAVTTYPCIWKANSLMIVSDTPYHYRQRSGSMSREYSELSDNQVISIYNAIGNNSIPRYINQVNLYMFFICLLRKYSFLSSYDIELFPFSDIKANDSIVLYGAGGLGKSIKSWIDNNSNIEVAAWVDKNATEYKELGLKVENIDVIQKIKYDYIVIAITNESIAEDIKTTLISMGCSENNILYITSEMLMKYELPERIVCNENSSI